ncbi:uncharacterized protein LOC129582708 isoform X2 [Paramacrobiotus metropolitanus]|uniref:uncharacterized protein LOC129582708 isoform X2 n=1 Tax=Paramacrobiotus metropolitanus TaxID=2943436 RepID=UPI002446460E|nr:uncharacterized protein LOC129582708 isoform X2 [Paramacrobiotus metropolitanus]
MVRSSQPTYKENASRQKENMHMSLVNALASLEEASRRTFNTRMEELIFPEKIWLICETNLLSRFMTWGDEKGMVMINLAEFEDGLLANYGTTHLFKTGKLVSFIRQFNLYDFKKKRDLFLDLDGQGNYTRFGLYYHQYLRSGDQQLLARCARKVVKRLPLSGNSVRVMKKDSESDEETQESISSSKGRRRRVTYRHSTADGPLNVPSKSGVIKRMSLRVANRRAKVARKNRVRTELQRTSLIQRWLEMPKEWYDLPELQRRRDPTARSLFEKYNWNLDPMVVGDLAALASYGMREDHSAPMTDEELLRWIKDMDKLPVLLSVVSAPVFHRL